MTEAVVQVGLSVPDEGKPIWRLMLAFLVPLILSGVLATISQTLGFVWIGRLISTQALGAIVVVFPLLGFLSSLFVGIASGGTILVAQAFGSGDHAQVRKIGGTVLVAAFVVGIVVGAAGALGSPAILSLLATPHDIIDQANMFARVLFLSMPLLFPYLVYTTIVRGTGDSKTPLYALIVSSVISVVLPPLLIIGWLGLPKLGVVSIAVSLIVANGVALVWFLWLLRASDHILQLDRKLFDHLRIDWKVLWSVVRLGVPISVEVVMISLSEIAMLSFINRFGSSATAAWGAVAQVISYAQICVLAVAGAAGMFGAQFIGARRLDKLPQMMRSAIGMNYVIGGIVIAACYLFSANILAWFITDQHTLSIARSVLMIMLWSTVIYGNTIVISRIMLSSGAVFWPTIIVIFSVWGIEVPAAYLLMQHLGFNGIVMGYPIAFCSGLFLTFCYYEFFWKRRSLEPLAET